MSDFYTPAQFCSILSGIPLGSSDHPISIKNICIDSRNISFANESVFFALKKEKRDGHTFISEAYSKGIRCFVVEQEPSPKKFPGAVFIKVVSTLNALHEITTAHRKRFTIPIVGITGSNGKTIVKEWLCQILSKTENVVKNPKSYNSQVGVPLSVWGIKKEHTIGVFEAGISQSGEMIKLARIIQPTIGIITNIGDAHDENFASKKEKCLEKLLLFEGSTTIVYCKDDKTISSCITANTKLSKQNLFSWSTTAEATLILEKTEPDNGGTALSLIYQGTSQTVLIPFKDPASIQNTMHCIAALLSMQYSWSLIKTELAKLSSVSMRLDQKEGINGCVLINDYYNSDLTSITIALDFLDRQKQHEKTTVILSDVLESGKDPKELYPFIARLLAEKKVGKLIGIGEQIKSFHHLFKSNSLFYSSTTNFLAALPEINFTEESILLKGSRAFEFEKISELLQKKTHDTILEINLSAIQENLNYYRSLIKKETQIMVMVKALSYGSGTYEIAKLLAFNKVDYLGVAYPDEGIALRNAGVATPIMVMNPETESYDTLLEHSLEPEAYNFRSFDGIDRSARKHFEKTNVVAKIHLKIDTGMHRLGFSLDEIPLLVEKINSAPYMKVASVLSHLATSDDPAMENFTKQQFNNFLEAKQIILSTLLGAAPRFHLLNSAGISAYPEMQLDMVRLGIGLYGVSSDEKTQKHLSPCSELKTTISQIRKIEKGTPVGYGCSFIAPRNMLIATVPIGYADGFRRSLSNGVGTMMVAGKPAPVVGNVCMDMTMIDVTNISAFEGQEVLVFGKNLPIQQFASAMNTIPYEALTSVSDRVKRVFFQE